MSLFWFHLFGSVLAIKGATGKTLGDHKGYGCVRVQYLCLTHLSTLVCDQGSEWLGVEAAVAESQAAVHTVSSQLQSLLTNVILMDRQTQISPKQIERFKFSLKLLGCEDLIS